MLDIEPVSGTVRVGPREALTVDRLEASHGRWCGAAPDRLEGTVQLRAHGAEHRAVVTTSDDGDRVTIELVDPAQGIAPGQAAVVYDGTRVVGSATITDASGGRPSPVELVETPAMTLATGVGSLPGTDPAEAVRIVVGELPDLPHLPELPGRGARRAR